MSSRFSGLWVLDPSRSEAPNVHLASLGLGDLAQSAATRINATVSLRIALRGSELNLVHCSSLGEKDRRITLGDPIFETGRDGTPIRLVTDAASQLVLRTQIDYGKARIFEIKTLASPDTLIQEVTMTLRGNITRTTRHFIRTTLSEMAAAAAAAAYD
jgi:hypothetical protein